MRKIKVVLLCLVMCFCTITAFGCDGGYKEVHSINYNLDGISTNISSFFEIVFEKNSEIEITQSDYLNFDNNFVLTNITNVYIQNPINKDKSNIPKISKGKTYAFKVFDICYKATIKELIVYFPKVKILDSGKLEIILSDGSISSIFPTSYNIEQFI